MLQENCSLKLNICYTLVKKEVTVISCKGYGSAVILPDFIKGYPVKKIGAYAFSDTERALFEIPGEAEVLYEEIPGTRVPNCREELIRGNRLKEIILPKYMEVIEKYAFYNCRELNTIYLHGGKFQVDSGAFMNCENLREIMVYGAPEEVPGVRGILLGLTSELSVMYMQGEETGIFLFPDYYEDSIENTPARITQELLYGAGYRYRQCFSEGLLDIRSYDEVFESADIQTIPETALRIVCFRLMYPYRLIEYRKNKYLEYLSKYIEKALKIMLFQDNIKGLEFLTGLELMTKKNFMDAQVEAVQLGRKECAGILLKEQLLHFPPIEKEFEL